MGFFFFVRILKLEVVRILEPGLNKLTLLAPRLFPLFVDLPYSRNHSVIVRSTTRDPKNAAPSTIHFSSNISQPPVEL